MIKYTLNCNNGHQFESWFSNSASFEKLQKNRHLECTVCHSKEVEKSLMAPRITPDSVEKRETLLSAKTALEKEIKALKHKIKTTATDVGENFPIEARAMHYGEKEEKPIIGKTTLKEAKDLTEEGIPFVPVPWSDDKVN